MKDFPTELVHGSGVRMNLRPSRLLLSFAEPTDRARVEDFAKDLGFELEGARDDPREKRGRFFEIVNHTDRRFWIDLPDDRPIEDDLYDKLTDGLGDRLEWAGPVYRLPGVDGRGGLLCPVPNVILIRGKRDDPRLRDAEDLLERYGAREIGEKSAYLGDFRYFELEVSRERNAYLLRDLLRRTGVTDARFENMPMLVPAAVVPNDTFFPQQWSMTQIRAGGPGTTGWDFGTGDPAVRICILDTGVDLTHPDLTFAPGAAGQGINCSTMMPTGAPAATPLGHGTCCAGNAAARFDNGAGVAGVAGSCSIMPAAFLNWTDAECAVGINWAAANGAHVISMSFGVYGPGEGSARSAGTSR